MFGPKALSNMKPTHKHTHQCSSDSTVKFGLTKINKCITFRISQFALHADEHLEMRLKALCGPCQIDID